MIQRRLRLSLSTVHARRRWHSFRRRTRVLRVFCNLLFLQLFVLVPMGYALLGASRPFLMLLAILWFTMFQIGLEFFSLHLRWFPHLRMERWRHFVSCILLPPSAMRMHDALSAPYFRDHHPLALASVLLPNPAFQEKAGAILRDLKFPLRPHFREADEETAYNHSNLYLRDYLQPLIDDFVEAHPVNSPHLVGKHCPRCLTPYEFAAAICPDCTGLPLVEAGPPTPETSA